MQIPVQGFMYPNEVELQWSVLIVLYPFITGLVAGAFILASLERVFRVRATRVGEDGHTTWRFMKADNGGPIPVRRSPP